MAVGDKYELARRLQDGKMVGWASGGDGDGDGDDNGGLGRPQDGKKGDRVAWGVGVQ